MSYKQPNTGNSMNDYFSSLSDFVALAPRLLHAKNEERFQVWLEKLETIDRRALFKYLQTHKEKIPKNHLRLAQRRFVEEI